MIISNETIVHAYYSKCGNEIVLVHSQGFRLHVQDPIDPTVFYVEDLDGLTRDANIDECLSVAVLDWERIDAILDMDCIAESHNYFQTFARVVN